MPELTYDLMLILSGNAEAPRRAEIATEAEALITKGGGTILDKTAWGERPLAFDIDHEAVGEYRIVRFQGPAESLEAISRQLNITEGLLRHRIIKAVQGAPATVQYQAGTAAAAPAAPSAPAPATPAPVEAPAPEAAEPAAPAEPAEAVVTEGESPADDAASSDSAGSEAAE